MTEDKIMPLVMKEAEALGVNYRIGRARAEGEGEIVVTWATGGCHKRRTSFEEWHERTPAPK
jgi:hypothetical protein